LDDSDSDRHDGAGIALEVIPPRRQVTAMTQPVNDARLEEIGFVDELAPTTSAIVVLGYN